MSTIHNLKTRHVDPAVANKEVLVRFYPDSKDRNNNRLLSVNTLRDEIGDAFTSKFVDKFWASGQQRASFKLRRGIEIVFVFR